MSIEDIIHCFNDINNTQLFKIESSKKTSPFAPGFITYTISIFNKKQCLYTYEENSMESVYNNAREAILKFLFTYKP